MRGLSDWYGSWKTICSLLPQRAHAGAIERRALEAQLAGARLLEPEQRARQRRLAAAGLADDAEHLVLAPLEVDAVERPHDAPAPPELHLEPARLGQRRDRGGERGDAHRTAPPAGACVSGANRQADSWSSPTGRRLTSPCAQTSRAR